jgi:hypothetical protein
MVMNFSSPDRPAHQPSRMLSMTAGGFTTHPWNARQILRGASGQLWSSVAANQSSALANPSAVSLPVAARASRTGW